MARIVVSEVMMMALRRRFPAVWIASYIGMPALRNSFMLSIFRMESFTTMPQVTMIPMADIRFSVCPHTHSVISAKAVSIGISTNTISGCTKLSNWAHRMKYISKTDTNNITTNSPIICSLLK